MSIKPNLSKYDSYIRYGSTQVLNNSKLHCQVSTTTLDAIAEQSMHQGYTNKRNPICSVCHIRKSSSGVCSC